VSAQGAMGRKYLRRLCGGERNWLHVKALHFKANCMDFFLKIKDFSGGLWYICFLKDFAKFIESFIRFLYDYVFYTNKILKKEPGGNQQEDVHGESRKDLLKEASKDTNVCYQRHNTHIITYNNIPNIYIFNKLI
jgi:hypothetical protein